MTDHAADSASQCHGQNFHRRRDIDCSGEVFSLSFLRGPLILRIVKAPTVNRQAFYRKTMQAMHERPSKEETQPENADTDAHMQQTLDSCGHEVGCGALLAASLLRNNHNEFDQEQWLSCSCVSIDLIPVFWRFSGCWAAGLYFDSSESPSLAAENHTHISGEPETDIENGKWLDKNSQSIADSKYSSPTHEVQKMNTIFDSSM